MGILLKGAVLMIIAALICAWIMTFAKWFPIKGIDGGLVKDYKALIRAHVDYLFMGLFCLAFYGIKIPLSVTACWLVVIGGITNPSILLMAALNSKFWNYPVSKMFTAASFAITTFGFLWIGKDILLYI